jgi:ureidoglycolate lyase
MELIAKPLTPDLFAPFGDVIAPGLGERMSINEGTTERFHNLAKVDVTDGHTLINVFRGQPRSRPIAIQMMERHPIGSQAFVPMHGQDYLIVVARPGESFDVNDLQAFSVMGGTGINYYTGTWHHPLLVLEADSDFLVVDRGGPGDNLDEIWFPDSWPSITLG